MEVLTQNGTCTPPPQETPSLKRALENNSPVQANGTHSLSENHHSDNPNTIGCQTALSYPKQDTLVPLTALLQLVNNSILTVMENIEKVLVVNSHDDQLFTPESINSFWQAANSSSATSPIEFLGQQERSPTSNVSPGDQGMDTNTETAPQYDIQSDTLSDESSERMRPIVIQDRFKNSLEIPPTEEEEISQPEKKFCPDPESSSPQCCTPPSSQPKDGQYNHHDNNALSPTVNVAGSLTKYICPYCYKVFNWKTNMNRHISVTHLMKPKPTIKVPIMRKSKPYTCPICGNTFAWRSNMNRHILHLHKIDHKQLNKLLLSAYLPDLRQPDAQQQVQAETTPNFSSLSSLTMLPQNNKPTQDTPQYKPDLSPSQPKTPPTSNAENPISYLYRNHKALLDSVKKEPVPLHIKEAALTSFYQNHKALFDAPQNGQKSVFDSPISTKQESPSDTAFTNVSPRKDHSPVQANNISPANMLNLQNSLNMANVQNSEISALSALYQSQRAILESTGRQNGQDIPLTSLYQNHKAMLDTVSLLSNLGGMNINNAGQATGDLADTQGIKIKVENGGEK